MKSIILIGALVSFFSSCLAQNDSIKSYTTSRVRGDAPEIDGKLDDPAWEQVEWVGGDFRQINPDKGKPASVQTKFKILYDSKNLYVGFRMYDPDPKKIVSRMSRRDGFEGDMVEINIDSYYDKRTAFSFTSSVSGVKGDEYVSNNGDSWDASWDPIWYLKTSIDSEGWIAEFRIPLSQLRFAHKPELIWGIQVTRIFFRNQERSVWQYIPPDAAGWVHLFGELKGITGIKPQKQLEIQPYIIAKTESFQKEEGNPFMNGHSSGVDLGLDAKVGITSDITLDLTVNPDFGQVEADPSQVNLSAFELFFQERRPFFIEGNNTLNFPVSEYTSNNLFYSRRIGRNPQGSVETDITGDDNVDEYVKPNRQSTILGAAKITGKNKKGFSWGILETMTALEKAEIDSLGSSRKQTVEPLTNYFVARAQQDIKKGNTLIGGMFTATNRKIGEPRLKWLHDEAYSGGIDLVHHWHERKFNVSARGFFSHVKGSTEAITTTQTSSERYFQRPDNKHASVDTLRTSLTGSGGMIKLGKRSGKIISDLALMWTSPGLELNDIGFLSQTDNIMQLFWMQYRILNPVKVLRWQRYNINQWQEWDFGRRDLSRGYNVNAHVEFKNLWRLSMGSTLQEHVVSNADLRGGPSIRYPGYFTYWVFAGTDNRKKFFAFVNSQWLWGFDNYTRNFNLDFEFIYQPVNALKIILAPSLSHNLNQLQYVTTVSSGGEDKYVVGEIDQTIARLSLRATYMITPNLSVQYWGQPFGSSGKYKEFKFITDARAPEYHKRFMPVPSPWLSFSNDKYQVDEDQDGNMDYSFNKPDFNFGQFRSNMVIRWEYIPGSTVFLVWTQERNGAFYGSQPDHEKYSFEFDQKAHNIFLLKFTYRFVL